jgi:hypothetical protein
MSINTHISKEAPMTRIDILRKRQARLREDIAAMLDSFLIGTVAKSPSMTGHNLTTKVRGKTVTLYVRKERVRKALEMGSRYQRLWTLIQTLSKINWEILNLENT